MKIEKTTDKLTTTPAITYSECYQQPFISLYHGDSLVKMKELESKSIDCILTDPPYKYLKNQKLEVDFDEDIFFHECKRLLKNNGFIVLFGRGSSFYRWNTILDNIGFNFKEEIIWDKSYTTSPLMPISRVHETISIWAKGNGSIKKVKIPYLEQRNNDINSIISDIKRLKSVFTDHKSFEAVQKYLQDGLLTYDGEYVKSTTITNGKRRIDRCVAVVSMMDNGMNEKTIIKEIRDHYKAIHPTQKPPRLIERLLALTTEKKEVVLDPFSGSCSTGIACINSSRQFIGYEIDFEYYNKSIQRLKNIQPALF